MIAKWFLALSPLIGVALAYVILYARHVFRRKPTYADLTLPPDTKADLWGAVPAYSDPLLDPDGLTKLVVDLHSGYGDLPFGETNVTFSGIRCGLADEAIEVRISGLLAFTVYWRIASMRHDIVPLDPLTAPRMWRWANIGVEVAPCAAPTIDDQALTDAVLPLLRQKHEAFKVDFERAKAEIEGNIEAFKVDFERAKAEIEAEIEAAKAVQAETRDAVLARLQTNPER